MANKWRSEFARLFEGNSALFKWVVVDDAVQKVPAGAEFLIAADPGVEGAEGAEALSLDDLAFDDDDAVLIDWIGHRPYPYYGGYYESGPERFVRQAREYAGRTEASAKAEPIYLSAYSRFPTYDDMVEQQKRWYFAWRTQVRAGTYPEVARPYLLIHIYELLNDVGVDSPEEGLGQLLGLWRAYRHPSYNVRTALGIWIEDYVALHDLPGGVPARWTDMAAGWTEPPFPDAVIAQAAAGPLEEMPPLMIGFLAGVDIAASSFYQNGNDGVLRWFIPLAAGAVDAQVRGKSKRGIMARFGPKARRAKQRMPFKGALYAPPRSQVRVPRPPLFSQPGRPSEVQPLFKGIVKHTENCLRAGMGVRSKLRGYDLAPEHFAIIEALVAEQLPRYLAHVAQNLIDTTTPPSTLPPLRPKISVDLHRVRSLRADSDHVRSLLLDGQDVAEPPPPPPPLPVDAPAPVHASATPEQASDQAASPWQRLLAALAAPQRAAIVALIAGDGPDPAEIRTIARAAGMMPEQLLDTINEAAIDTVGDAIIDVTGDAPVLYEEYRAEIVAIAHRPPT